MIEKIKRALERLARKREVARGNRKQKRQRRREKKQGRDEAREQRDRAARQLDAALDQEPRDQRAVAELRDQVREYDAKVERRARAFEHARHRARKLTSWLKWSAKRQTYLRKRLREAKEQDAPKFEPYMANGHEGHLLTAPAKKLLAIMVVRYGLYCTSIYRGWGTGSWHDVIPTRVFDCAGARMREAQQDLRYGRINGFELGDLLELIGPDGSACAKNGQPWVLAESSALALQHDNHDHEAVYGS